MFISLKIILIMNSILGIVKGYGRVEDALYTPNLKPVFFKDFCVVNLVLNISKIESIKKIEFILLDNFKNMTQDVAESFLDKFELVVQFSNNYENSQNYISKNKERFVFIESPVIFRSVNKSTISQKYLRIMHADHLGRNFIKKYNKNFIRSDFQFPFFEKIMNKKENNEGFILLVNQMVNDSAISPIDPYIWANKVVKEIRKYSNNKIVFRDHPLQIEKYLDEKKKLINNENLYFSNNDKIEDDLLETKCCVTFSSGSAIECLFAQIPVIATDKRSFVYEIVENEVSNINKLQVPNLNTLKSALSFTHYSLNEILDGTCWRNIKGFI